MTESVSVVYTFKGLQNGSSEHRLHREAQELESNDLETEVAAIACNRTVTSAGLVEQVNRRDECQQSGQKHVKGRGPYETFRMWLLHGLLTISGTLPYLLKVI